MTNCIFYALIFVLFLNFTSGTIKFSEVNRTFMSMYRGIFEASSISIDKNGSPTIPYFDQNLLMNYIAKYLDDNLPKYVTNYEYDCKFIERNTLEICSEMCRDVTVTLKAEINDFYTYDKTQTFSVYQRGNL